MSTWQVRQEGSPSAVRVPSASEVLAGLRDGVWLPTDEVKGPTDTRWEPIESHPAFEEAAAEMEAEPAHHADETHLDMNPLIDVCLVLLIFFILTISYESLERAIAVPQDNEEKGTNIPTVKYDDIKDRVFVVVARMDSNSNNPIVKLEKETVTIEELDKKMKALIDRTGRKEMLLDLDGDVPWGIETAILDAAKGNGVHNILLRPKPRK